MGTEIKQVNGFVGNNDMLWKGRILISVTSQQDGEIVTLQEGNARMSVLAKDVERLIEKARKSK